MPDEFRGDAIIPSRKAAQNPRVAEIIGQAEVIFIAGGDQSRYVKFWKGTPVEDAINAHVAAGKPIGGTSAGLAVLGEFVYGCLEDKPNDADLTSREVLADPYMKRVTVVRDFLKVPGLENILTDSHFATRDRMGRSLGFLARIVQDGWSKTPREIAIDEKSALLVEASGRAKVVGTGLGVYFLQVTDAPETLQARPALDLAQRRGLSRADRSQVRRASLERRWRRGLLDLGGGRTDSHQPRGERGVLRSCWLFHRKLR